MTPEKINKLKQFYSLDSKSKDNIYVIDDITFNDFRLNDIFEKMDCTVSSLGEEVLYGMLRKPAVDSKEYEERLKSIHYFESNPDRVSEIRKRLTDLNKLKRVSCFEYLEHMALSPNLSTIEQFAPAIALLIALALMAFNVTLGIILAVAVYFYNAINYFKRRDKVAPYFISLSYISKAVKVGLSLKEVESSKYAPIAFLKNASLLLGTINGETVNGGSGNPLDVLLDILKMGFHVDIIRFYSLRSRIISNKDIIFEYLKCLGQLDAYASISQYRLGLDYYCEPEFDYSPSGNYLTLEEGIYPLNESPRPNSIDTCKPVLLTGSNASGKSTFLRMVGFNAVMAQSICTVLAKRYRAPLYRIVSSMSITDDVLKGDSFYMAEIKSLKRILDLANLDVRVMCFVDEVLKGTNTAERISASSALLKKLATKSLCFAASHDIELTELLKDNMDNYHFNEQMEGEDISFDYTLKKGPSDTRNAIKLLEIMKFDKDIIDEAIHNFARFGL